MSSKNNTNAGKVSETTGAAPTAAPEGAQTPATGAVPTAAPEGVQAPTTYPIFIPMLPGKHQPDLVGSLHGIPFQLPRGQVANLPKPIYEIVKEMQKNEAKADQEYYGVQAQLLARAKEEEERIIGK